MKKILAVLVIILLGVVFWYGNNSGYQRAERRYLAVIDSVNAIAAAAPDTIWKTDTIRPKPEIKWYPKEVPVPVKTDSVHNFYADSLVNDQLAIYVNDTIEGILQSRNIGYKLFVPLKVTNTITVTEKVPVIISEPAKKQAELYGGLLLPYSYGKFGLGISADYITKKDRIVGAQYLTVGDKSIIVGKIGVKF